MEIEWKERHRGLQNQLSETETTLSQLRSKHADQANSSGKTQHMIRVAIVEAKNILPEKPGSLNAYVQIYYNNQKYTTKVLRETMNPVWNEQYAFFLGPEEEKLQLAVWHEGVQKDIIKGTANIPIPKEPKNSIDYTWVSLYNEEGMELPSKIMIGLQYVEDTVKMVEGQIMDEERKKETIKQEIAYLSDLMNSVIRIFFLVLMCKKGPLDILIANSGPLLNFNDLLGSYRRIDAAIADKVVQIDIPNANWDLIRLVAVIIFGVLSLITLFGRSDYLNVFF